MKGYKLKKLMTYKGKNSHWRIISLHRFYITALWAFFNEGGTCKIESYENKKNPTVTYR